MYIYIHIRATCEVKWVRAEPLLGAIAIRIREQFTVCARAHTPATCVSPRCCGERRRSLLPVGGQGCSVGVHHHHPVLVVLGLASGAPAAPVAAVLVAQRGDEARLYHRQRLQLLQGEVLQVPSVEVAEVPGAERAADVDLLGAARGVAHL